MHRIIRNYNKILQLPDAHEPWLVPVWIFDHTDKWLLNYDEDNYGVDGTSTLKPEIRKWCNENRMRPRYGETSDGKHWLKFSTKSQRLLFKLRWAGN